MKNIAIVTWPFFGHIFPTISLGDELIKKGYKVFWISQLDILSTFIPKEGEFIKIDFPENKSDNKNVKNEQGLLKSIVTLYCEHLVPINKRIYEQLNIVFSNYHFDYVITDQQSFAGAAIAFNNQVPFCVSVTAPASIDNEVNFPEAYEFEKQQIIKFQKSVGITCEESLVHVAEETLVFSSKEFLNIKTPLKNHSFLGTSLSSRKEYELDFSSNLNQKNNAPIVLISFGSVIQKEDVFLEYIIDAFRNEYLKIILVSDPKRRENWPSNFFVYPHIPQLKVLSLVDAVISHGGHNTVSESLSFGKPIVVIPMLFDQSYVANKIQDCGVGVRLKYKRLNAGILRNALGEVLKNKEYSKAALKIKESFINAGGPVKGAEIIIQHMNRKENSILKNNNYG